MYLLLDENGRKLAEIEIDPPNVISDDSKITDFGITGVPSRRGIVQGDVASEASITVLPTDPLWGLALLEWAEDRGYTIQEL